mgnify:CR=1 FL=1
MDLRHDGTIERGVKLAPFAAGHDRPGGQAAKLAARGRLITGGTLDKLDAIAGYQTDLSGPEFLDTIKACGCSITGQTESLAPAPPPLSPFSTVLRGMPILSPKNCLKSAALPCVGPATWWKPHKTPVLSRKCRPP